MLINKGATIGETVSIKLISGEEIIARLEEETSDKVKIYKPLSVNISSTGLGMMPFMFLAASDTLEIKTQHIIAMSASKKEAADQYVQGTTGLALR